MAMIRWELRYPLHCFFPDYDQNCAAEEFIIIVNDPQSKNIYDESQLLAAFVLGAPIIFPFLTDNQKNYLMQMFVNKERCIWGPVIDENMSHPRLAPIIRFAMLCKETYVQGNVMPRPISDGELDVIPRGGTFPVSNPTRRETISMLEDLYRLGGVKRRLSSWRDPINRTVRRIFIIACRKDQIKFVVGDLLSLILCHLWEAVYPL